MDIQYYQSKQEVENALKWTEESLKLLRKLLETLDITVETWERFSSWQGDVGYFSNLSSPIGGDVQGRSVISLVLIKERFERLKCLREQLYSQRGSCERLRKAVSNAIVGFKKVLTGINSSNVS